MRLSIGLVLFCILPFLVCSIKSSSSHQASLGLDVAPTRQGDCVSNERNVSCTADDTVLNCICYQNGTCISDYINRCTACADTEVKSVNQGCCASSVAQRPSMEGICRPEERNLRCFAYLPVPSCICFMNGTCVDGKADRCTDCGNEDIYSIYEGTCKEPALSHASDLCLPKDRFIQCYYYELELSCVCYYNGTCETKKAHICRDCHDSDVASISKGCCAATTARSLSDDCRHTPLKKCDKEFLMRVRCRTDLKQGCICYDNGTCEEGLVNYCVQCQQNDVLAVEEGSKCPCPGVQQSQS